MLSAAGPLAVLGLRRDDGRDPVQGGQLPRLAGLIDQAALALDRARLAGDARQLARVEERDRPRATLLQSVAHDLRTPLTIIQAFAAELERGATPALIATVRAEAERLKRFVGNLLDNAGRYAAAASPLDIIATCQPDGLDLAISDTGPGLPPGSDPFTAFRRLKGSDRVAGGTGLGLAIVKGFADGMGVGVSAANRSDGSDAVFTLNLPDALLVRAPAEAML